MSRYSFSYCQIYVYIANLYVNRYVYIFVCVYVYSYSLFTQYYFDLAAVSATTHEKSDTISSEYWSGSYLVPQDLNRLNSLSLVTFHVIISTFFSIPSFLLADLPLLSILNIIMLKAKDKVFILLLGPYAIFHLYPILL